MTLAKRSAENQRTSQFRRKLHLEHTKVLQARVEDKATWLSSKTYTIYV